MLEFGVEFPQKYIFGPVADFLLPVVIPFPSLLSAVGSRVHAQEDTLSNT